MILNSIAVLLLLNLVLVCSQLGPFINPPERLDGASPDGSTNPVYAVGNLLNITWTPANGTASLTIWQTRPNGSDVGGLQYLPGSRASQLPKRRLNVADTVLESMDKSYYTWHPIGVNGDNNQPNFDLATSNIFHFDLYENGARLASGLSLWFNLTNDTINAQGFVISTATSSVSLSASTSSSATTIASSKTTSPTSSPSPSHARTGLSSGAKAGIGVGVALGALVVIVGATGAFIWNRSKIHARVNDEQLASPYVDNPPTTTVRKEYKVEMDVTTPQQRPTKPPKVEMDRSSQPGGPVELPSNAYFN
jgi:hypothetical protein